MSALGQKRTCSDFGNAGGCRPGQVARQANEKGQSNRHQQKTSDCSWEPARGPATTPASVYRDIAPVQHFRLQSRLFDLNGKAKTLSIKHSSAIIVRRR